MDASAPSRSAGAGAGWAPKPFVLWAIALDGCAAAVCSVWLAFASDHVAEPGLQAALID
jgi:hypothetical protein